MPNDIKLQSKAGTHPLDENLRPLIVGDKVTPLEISDTDVKVNNLVVSGTTDGVLASDPTKLPLAGGTMTGNLEMGSNDVTTTGTINTPKVTATGDLSIIVPGYDAYFTASDGANLYAQLSGAASELAYLALYPDGAGSHSTYLFSGVDGLTTLTSSDATGTTAHITLDADGDVILDPHTGVTKFYLAGDTDDLCTLTVAANGATTIATADSDGTVGHLTLDVDGGITLDPATGAFVSKNNGTEFSVANSAYAGMILGYTTVGIDAADDSYTLTDSFAVTDSAHKVKFVAPPSGVVEIFVSIYGDFFRRITYLGLSDNATYNTLDATHEHIVSLPPTAAGDRVVNHRWVITGLTAGTAYEYWLGAKSSHGAAIVLRWGGDKTAEYAPFIMKATALPTAVADYAVYG